MKKGIYSVVMMGVVLGAVGCGASNNLSGAKDGYGNEYYYGDDSMGSDLYGSGIYGNSYGTNGYSYNKSMEYETPDYSKGGKVYWDGYGINSGRPLDDEGTSYGDKYGSDIDYAYDYNYEYDFAEGYTSNSEDLLKTKNLTNDMKDMGNNLDKAGEDIVDTTKDIFEGTNTNSLVN